MSTAAEPTPLGPSPPTSTTMATGTTSQSPTTSSSSSHLKASSSSMTTATDRQIAEARRALEASMHNIGSHLDSTLKSRAQNLHANNAVLDKQIAELQEGTKSLSKETDKLKKVADDAARKLKEIGNVQNWAEVMEREFLILGETVRLANESDAESDYGPCRVCGKRVEESGEDLLWCRGCEGEFHLPCVGLESVPRDDWFCAECEHQGTYLQSVGKSDTVEQSKNVVNGDVEMGGVENTEKVQEKEMVHIEGHKHEDAFATASGNELATHEISNGVDHEMSGMGCGMENGEIGKGKKRDTPKAEGNTQGSSTVATDFSALGMPSGDEHERSATKNSDKSGDKEAVVMQLVRTKTCQ